MRCLLVLFLLAFLAGCARQVTAPPLALMSDEYDRAFDTAVDVLRDARFTIDRVDRRSGVITTEARVSSTIVEPWRPDNATLGMSVDSTLNYQRRVVRVQFTDVDAAEASDLTALPGGKPLGLAVTCTIERAHRPNRRVETAALARSSQAVDPQLQERGIGLLFWQPVGRDPNWEQTIRATLALRLAEPPAPAKSP